MSVNELILGVIIPLLLGIGMKLSVWAISRFSSLQKSKFAEWSVVILFHINYLYAMILLIPAMSNTFKLMSDIMREEFIFSHLSGLVYLFISFILFLCTLSIFP